jgi:hypothetical protein
MIVIYRASIRRKPPTESCKRRHAGSSPRTKRNKDERYQDCSRGSVSYSGHSAGSAGAICITGAGGLGFYTPGSKHLFDDPTLIHGSQQLCGNRRQSSPASRRLSETTPQTGGGIIRALKQNQINSRHEPPADRSSNIRFALRSPGPLP